MPAVKSMDAATFALDPGPAPVFSKHGARRALERTRDVFDSATDRVIRVTGSPAVLGTAALFEAGWLAAGKPCRFSNGWQLVMSDVSTIAVFWMNPVLQNAENGHARHQQAAFGEAVATARAFAEKARQGLTMQGAAAHAPTAPTLTRSCFDRGAARVGRVVGAPGFYLGCLAGLGAWAGLGAPMHWNNAWQLILNSATSAFELPAVLTLHNTKLHDDIELGQLLSAEIKATRADADAMGQGALAPFAGHTAARPPGFVSRAIHFVARLEGSPVAIAVQVGLVSGWPGLGPVMHWGDNWQLVLGTTTSIASYVFLLVLMHTHRCHTRVIAAAADAMVEGTEAALEQLYPDRAAAARKAFVAGAPQPGIAARFTAGCHRAAASTAGVLVGCGAIGAWAATKPALDFTTWMLVINSATMVAQTLAFVLIMNAHHRASARARRYLAYHAQLRAHLAGPLAMTETLADVEKGANARVQSSQPMRS